MNAQKFKETARGCSCLVMYMNGPWSVLEALLNILIHAHQH